MRERRRLSDRKSIHDSTGYWVARLSRAIALEFEKHLDELGLTRTAYVVLGAIHYDRRTTPAELASFIGIHGAAITRHLDRIEERGYVVRRRSTSDRRSIRLELTPQGVRAVHRGRRGSDATNERFRAGLTQTEIDQFRSTILKMLANADEAPADL
jgi:DNA-binding MarR family transcriptional regulator